MKKKTKKHMKNEKNEKMRKHERKKRPLTPIRNCPGSVCNTMSNATHHAADERNSLETMSF